MNINTLINNYQKDNNDKTRSDLLMWVLDNLNATPEQLIVSSELLKEGYLLEMFEMIDEK